MDKITLVMHIGGSGAITDAFDAFAVIANIDHSPEITLQVTTENPTNPLYTQGIQVSLQGELETTFEAAATICKRVDEFSSVLTITSVSLYPPGTEQGIDTSSVIDAAQTEVQREALRMEATGDDTPLEELEIGIRSLSNLKRQNITTIGNLVSWTIEEIRKMPNIGPKSEEEILAALAKRHLYLRAR